MFLFFDAFGVVAFLTFMMHLDWHFRASTVMREAHGELLVKFSTTSIFFWLLIELSAFGFPITKFFVSYNVGHLRPTIHQNMQNIYILHTLSLTFLCN